MVSLQQNLVGSNLLGLGQQSIKPDSSFNLDMIDPLSFDALSSLLPAPTSSASSSVIIPQSSNSLLDGNEMSIFEHMMADNVSVSSDPSEDFDSNPASPDYTDSSANEKQAPPPFRPSAGRAGKCTNNDSKHGPKSNKREPLPEDFDDEETFKKAWAKWRDDRDHNNRSVKRSRQRAKLRKLEALKVAQSSSKTKKSEGSPEAQLEACKIELHLLVRLIKKRSLTTTEQKRVNAVIERFDDPSACVSRSKRRTTKGR